MLSAASLGLAPPPSAAATAASVGRVACDGRELLVLGTAHTPCASAAEARALVASAKPDVLMLEIDQERLDALLQRGSSLYGVPLGAEFAAAFEEGEGVGAIPVLGDAKVTRATLTLALRLRCSPPPLPRQARDTLDALRLGAGAWFADPKRFRRAIRIALPFSAADDVEVKTVDIPAAIREDPDKVTPLLISLLISAALVGLSTLAPDVPEFEFWGDALDIFIEASSLLVAARVFDVLLISRDERLSESALAALEIAAGTRSGLLLRRTFSFPTRLEGIDAMRAAAPAPSGATPLFTMKTPLRAGVTRRLNLFEPRWLAMMDAVAAENGGDLVGARFGCLHVANRCYWGAPPFGDGEDEERRADVTVHRAARWARVTKVVEGSRPVSGSRRLSVWITGEESFAVGDDLAPYAGVLHARPLPSDGEAAAAEDEAADAADATGPARVVAVVGLAHANGVIKRCAQRALEG